MSRGNQVATTAKTPPSFDFQPPAGGDVDLKSSDDVIFRAHSVLLGLASTVFAGMFDGATNPDTVELAEDAEAISLMLAFIYPVAPPAIDTHNRLEKFMLVAQKYHIDKMLKHVERTITSKNKLVLSDPIRVFRASVQHSFPTIQTLAARSLRSSQCDLTSVEGLLKLSKMFPNASSIIGLVGAQGARAKILTSVLLQHDDHAIWPKHALRPNYRPIMICTNCWNEDLNRAHCGGNSHEHYRPGWLNAWAYSYYNAILDKPLHQCESFIQASCLEGMKAPRFKTCNACIVEASKATAREVFQRWAEGVKEIVEIELEALNALYSL